MWRSLAARAGTLQALTRPPLPHTQLALLVALMVGSAVVRGRMAFRRQLADTKLALSRYLNGADAHGWSRCSAACGWGTQTRQLTSCSPLETRPCWGPGVVGCDGECNSGAVFDCLGVCGGQNVLDDCGVCAGLNKAKDCAGICFGNTPTGAPTAHGRCSARGALPQLTRRACFDRLQGRLRRHSGCAACVTCAVRCLARHSPVAPSHFASCGLLRRVRRKRQRPRLQRLLLWRHVHLSARLPAPA